METRTSIARRIARTFAAAALFSGLNATAQAADIDFEFFNGASTNTIYLWLDAEENEFRGRFDDFEWEAGSNPVDSASLATWQVQVNADNDAAILYGDRLAGIDNMFEVEVKLQGTTGGSKKQENASNIEPTIQFAMVNWVNHGGQYSYTIEDSGVVDYEGSANNGNWVLTDREFAFENRIAMPNDMTLTAVNPAPIPVPPAVFMMASGLGVLMFKRGLPRRLGAATA